MSNPIREAVAREKIRRAGDRKEKLDVLRRVLRESGSGVVRTSFVKRILLLCGIKVSQGELVDLVYEAFPMSVWARDEGNRVFKGVAIKRGFTIADIGAYLKRKFEASVRLPANRKRPASSVGGVVANWESQLEVEGMTNDVYDQRDPVARNHLQLPTHDDDDEEEFRDPLKPRYGWGANDPLAGWPARATPNDPSIGPDLAHVRTGVAELAFRIPGFFGRGGRGKDLAEIWRLVRIEGMTHPMVAKFVGRTVTGVTEACRHVERRLMKHLRALGEGNVRKMMRSEGTVPVRIRYLYGNHWRSPVERAIWEKTVFEKATPPSIAAELGIDPREVARIVRRHRVRCKLRVEEL